MAVDKLKLSEKLFVQNRLRQEGPTDFRLEPRYRQQLADARQRNTIPELPDPAPYTLIELAALTRQCSLLAELSPGTLAAVFLDTLLARTQALAQCSADGAIAAILLCPRRDHAAHHAVGTALLACLIADALALPADEQRLLGLAALAMNLGAASLQNELAQQDAPLSTLQRQELHIHPIVSSALLRESGIQDARLHLVILTHHEQSNGRGYPFGLPYEAIDPLAQLLHLLDITMAKLLPRSYRQGVPLRSALAGLLSNANSSFDTTTIAHLVKILGLYPAGSFVALESELTAVVIAQTEDNQAPLVASLDQSERIDTSEPGQRVLKNVAAKVSTQQLAQLGRLWPM
ncbi:HD-GYP domain-containing protein [Chitinolyticbacter albus]|uniref:HD-GYP domain-containing protein n=1 Tax=Chitinolyticbacter albus TaxID=2961951 RepID=UPI002109CADA|nr:HD domain-containing phosphohydrolase [Chitinolyticbacter albus]